MSAGVVLLGTAFAVLAVAAATAAVSSRDARVALIGMLAALLAAPFLADPLPDLRGIAARIAGASLGAYPLWMLYRGRLLPTEGSPGGIVVDGVVAIVAALAAASAAVGWDVGQQLGAPGVVPAPLAGPLGPLGTILATPFVPAVAAGGALLVLAIAPVAFAREPLRLVIGLTLGLLGITLLDAGLTGPPDPFTNLSIALTLAALGGGGAVMVVASSHAARPLGQKGQPGLRSLPPLHLPRRGDGPHGPRPADRADEHGSQPEP